MFFIFVSFAGRLTAKKRAEPSWSHRLLAAHARRGKAFAVVTQLDKKYPFSCKWLSLQNISDSFEAKCNLKNPIQKVICFWSLGNPNEFLEGEAGSCFTASRTTWRSRRRSRSAWRSGEPGPASKLQAESNPNEANEAPPFCPSFSPPRDSI